MSDAALISQKQDAVYVYEAPVRIWHWINAACIMVLFGTGYLIGSPPGTGSGEPSAHFFFGWIRFFHFAAGQLLVVGMAFRFYWSFVGNDHSRQIFRPPFRSREFWDGVLHEIRWYAMIEAEPRKYSGHNPLAVLTMHIMFVWGIVFMGITGLALYGEGEGAGIIHWWITKPVLWWFNNSQEVHTLHHLGMWAIVIFAMVHIYVAVREDIMSRQSIMSSMFSGWRSFRDDDPLDDGH